MKIVVDTGPLILFVVGLAGRNLIKKHPQTKNFKIAHFEFLLKFISVYEKIVVTPHSLAELYYFIGEVKRGDDHDRKLIHANARILFEECLEIYCPAVDLLAVPALQRFGLTDISQIEAAKQGHEFITIDGRLYSEALHQGVVAHNFKDLISDYL